MGHLQKLIRAKYDLTDNHRVDLLHNQDCLNSYLTLMDIAYIYLWRRVSFNFVSRDFDNERSQLQKGPLELTYRIYENTKHQNCNKEQGKTDTATDNNSDWKEVQLRISENGEMSVTGIQDVLREQIDSKTETKPAVNAQSAKREPPALKLIAKTTVTAATTSTSASATSDTSKTKTKITVPVSNNSATVSAKTTVASTEAAKMNENCIKSIEVSSNTCGVVVKTLNSVSNTANTVTVTATTTIPTSKPQKTMENHERAAKHKLQDGKEGEPPQKQVKQTILNHSLGLHHLSNNHPLKKHSQIARNLENETKTQAEAKSQVFTKPTTFVNKTFANVQSSRPGTPITTQKWPTSPCYMPKTTFSPIINVPKVQTGVRSEAKIQVLQNTAITIPTTAVNTKMTIKSKPSTPIGYKTLRDPPKSWNPQISRASLNKTSTDPKYTDLKNVRPAKFFKIRNNMPRYLGNPASGVKPMYQLHSSPEKEKSTETGSKSDKSEIKKHSIVKIDPKTLKPISEKAPETSSLSTPQSDLKISTSSVPIFQPLKLQSSPKSERKSPKSPHSPKLKSTSPPNKREKLNLNFTPPNPFIPNLTSPTVSPGQFLYPSGPPGFPSYDPRFMAAYHSLLYGQRMPFSPNPLQSLSQANRGKPFELPASTSPKMSPQLSPKCVGPSSPKLQGVSQNSKGIMKKSTKDGQKVEKSLQNAVEKLTQNRVKENKKNEENLSANENQKSEETAVKKEQEKAEESAPKESDKLKENAVDKVDDVQSDIKDKSEIKVDTGTKLVEEKNLSNNNTDSVTSLVKVEGKD